MWFYPICRLRFQLNVGHLNGGVCHRTMPFSLSFPDWFFTGSVEPQSSMPWVTPNPQWSVTLFMVPCLVVADRYPDGHSLVWLRPIPCHLASSKLNELPLRALGLLPALAADTACLFAGRQTPTDLYIIISRSSHWAEILWTALLTYVTWLCLILSGSQNLTKYHKGNV